MKKTLIALTCVLTLGTSHAENWQTLAKTGDNISFMIDADSFSDDVKTEDGVAFIGALFRYEEDDKPTPTFVFTISEKSCKDKNGDIFLRAKNDKGEWVTAETYHWGVSGNKSYDVAGKILCAGHMAVQEHKKHINATTI